ncbi:MAG TPA: glycosyltransferase, partial [Armatimonadota bacterium]
MHVTLVNNYLYLRGGAERVVFEETEFLRQQQVTVSHFSRRHAQNIPTPYDAYFPPFVDPFTLPLAGKVRHAPRMIYNAHTYRSFIQFLQSVQPQLIHAHNIYGGLTSAISDAATRQGIPMVMTLHDYKLLCPAYLMLRKGQVCEACLHGRYLRCIVHSCHKDNFLY